MRGIKFAAVALCLVGSLWAGDGVCPKGSTHLGVSGICTNTMQNVDTWKTITIPDDPNLLAVKKSAIHLCELIVADKYNFSVDKGLACFDILMYSLQYDLGQEKKEEQPKSNFIITTPISGSVTTTDSVIQSH